jgi:hypothetical protein
MVNTDEVVLLDCYGCGCPVEIRLGKLAEAGITLELLTARNLRAVCRVCVDMLEVEGCPTETMDQFQMKEWIDSHA